MLNILKSYSRLTQILLSLLFLISLNSLANSHKEIDELLIKADEIRSKNPLKLKLLLEEIKSNTSLTHKQRHYLNYLVAYQQSFSGRFKQSLETYQTIINSDADASIKFRANLSIVNIHAISQNWKEGLNQLSNLFLLYEMINEQHLKEQGSLVTSMLYNLLGQYELGLLHAAKILDRTNNKRNKCLANHFLLRAKLHLNLLYTSSLEIKTGIESCEVVKEYIASSEIRTYLASLHISNKNYLEAKELLQSTLQLTLETKYAPIIAKYYALLAEIYYEESSFKESENYAQKTLIKTQGSGNSKPLISAYSILYKINLHEQSYQKALIYYEKYSEAKTAHLEGEKAKHLAFQLAEHQAFEQESQIKLLNEQNNALAAEQALAKTEAANKKLVILSLILIIVILAFFGVRFYRAHKRVKELAEYDPLTGIFNRGHFTQVTESALKYCQNAKQDLSLIMFDLDHFKKVNDTFGHGCGDWALKETIKVCKSIGRKNDIFARLGGEEFCLVLPSCNIDAAMLRAEDCRAAIEAIITEESTHEFTITASFGVTDVKRSGFNLDNLLADADMAAYESKRSGRNRVTVHQVPEPKKPSLDNAWSLD